jgi:hypothetical protein
MTRTQRACRVRGFCLWIGLGAFLVAEPGACLAQARPLSPGPPGSAGAGAGPGISAIRSLAIPAIGMRLPTSSAHWTRLLARTAGDNAQDRAPGSAGNTGTPVYKKAWFIAAAVGVAAVAVLLLASGGGNDERPGPQSESLPGFPPPPAMPASIGLGGSVR